MTPVSYGWFSNPFYPSATVVGTMTRITKKEQIIAKCTQIEFRMHDGKWEIYGTLSTE
jgi:hypothetical protein